MKKLSTLLLGLAFIFANEAKSQDLQSNETQQSRDREYAADGDDVYVDREVCGFVVKIKESCQNEPEAIKALELMKKNLAEVHQLLSPEVVSKMQQSPIWLEKDSSPRVAACYHPSKQWLINNDKNPDKAECVEILNYAHYLNWSAQNQPYMLFHELMHLYHNQVLGGGNKDVADAYQKAKESGYYHNLWCMLSRGNYKIRDAAYGMNNNQEYFAEICEAYFGRNDFFPFDYYDLKDVDPTGFALMERVWGKRDVEPIEYSRGVSAVPADVVEEYDLDLFYRRYIDADGTPVLASRHVSNEALSRAAQILKSAPELVAKLAEGGKIRVAVIGREELLFEMPENRYMYDNERALFNARGCNATAERPLISISEEALLAQDSDCELIKEVAKSMYRVAIEPTDNALNLALESAYNNSGLLASADTKSDAAIANYFADGVATYYTDKRSLKKSDKELYKIVVSALR